MLVPKRAESEDGTVIGDGMLEVGPVDPDFKAWDEWMKRTEGKEE